MLQDAHESIARCRALAAHSEEPGFTTRTFLSEPMHAVHADVGRWMTEACMNVTVDAAGNLRGFYPGTTPVAPRLIVCSHLDTVPRAGAFDGILGVVLGVKLVERLQGRRLRFGIEVIGFSEEEGVRFGVPFIGSRAFIGDVNERLLASRDSRGVSVAEAIRAFGLDPALLGEAKVDRGVLGSLEFHIEQGPVLESLGAALGVVSAISGQSRFQLTFEGRAAHAGTTPMHLRRDALAGSAEWIGAVERAALVTANLVATVGSLEAHPGATNVIAGSAKATLDIRHPDDATRRESAAGLIAHAQTIAAKRGLGLSVEPRLDQPAVAMDAPLTDLLARAAARTGDPVPHLSSGAGHDSMILAARMPTAMLFLRSPRGLSHHPDESVRPEDVAAALAVGAGFLEELENTCV